MAEKGQSSELIRSNYFKENFNRNYKAALEINSKSKPFKTMISSSSLRKMIGLRGTGD